jgi:hypothetical protein
MAEFVGASKEFDEIVGVKGSQSRLHGAEMLIAKREKVGPHSKRV